MRMTYAQIDNVYRELNKLKDSFGPHPNKRDRAVVLIGCCILHGFDTKYQIMKALRSIGLSTQNVAGILEEQTGEVLGLHLWWLDPDGIYHLHDNLG